MAHSTVHSSTTLPASSDKIVQNEISVSIANLTKLYRNNENKRGKAEEFIVANEGISLEIYQGEVFGLLGPNGAGKTTLVNQILGLIKPDTGSIIIEGIDVVKQPSQIKKITAYLSQQTVDFGSLEVKRLLVYTGQLRGQKKTEAQEQADYLIKQLALEEVASRYIDRLSGGMQRVANLAIALMGHPRLLVLDEPTNELDPTRRRLVWNFLRSTLRITGSTCILVTHSLVEAAPILDRVGVMRGGKIIALGTPGSLKQNFSRQARFDLTFKETVVSQYETLQKLLTSANLTSIARITQDAHNPLVVKVEIPPEQADEVLKLIIHGLGLDYLDDWSLAPASLEDAYLELVGGYKDENDQL